MFDMNPSPKRIISRYKFLRKELMDMRPVWNAMIPKLRRHMGSVWMSRGGTAGVSWPPLSPRTLAHRGHKQVGVNKGRMLARITTNGVLIKNKRLLRFGVKHPGARSFHFGRKAASSGKNQPARPFVVATRGVIEMAAAAWTKHVDDVLSRFPIPTSGREQVNNIIRGKTP